MEKNRILNHSLTHPPHLMPREPKLSLRIIFTYNAIHVSYDKVFNLFHVSRESGLGKVHVSVKDENSHS